MEDISGYHSCNGQWYVYQHWKNRQEELAFEKWKCPDCDDVLQRSHTDYKIWYEHVKKVHWKTKKKYAFTFTTNLNTGLEIQIEMCRSAERLFRQNTTPVEEGRVYLEYTEEGRPHLHGWYVCRDGGRIFAKTFRRCWRYWGEKARQTRFAGGYHEEIKSERYQGYASDEGRLVVSKEKDSGTFYAKGIAENWHANREEAQLRKI